MRKRRWLAWGLAGALMLTGLTPAAVQAETSEPSAWAQPEVEAAAQAGILEGAYEYQREITRLQFAELVDRMIRAWETQQESGLEPGLEPAEEEMLPAEAGSSSSPFSDTDSEAVRFLNEQGILQGYGDGRFHPEDSITREQIACVLARTAEYLGIENPNGYVTAFQDGKDFSPWAIQSVKFISAQETPEGVGVMRGYSSRFLPKGTCTVEEGILAVYRLYRSLERGGSDDDSWKEKRGWLFTEVRLSAAGDCTLGRDLNAAYATSLDAVYDQSGGDAGLFFRNVPPFFSDDVTIVNFEGTLTDANQAAVKTFRFKGRKAYTEILKQGSIDVVNIANNHSHDYLERGYIDTYQTLTAAGIAVCGNGYTYVKTVNGIKVGFYGLAPMGSGLTKAYQDTIRARIAALKNQGAQYIVGSFHWGIERAYTANANQKQIAHFAVDSGTDLVLGHHPHVLQNTEVYNGVQIVYSLGNFCFGGNKNPSDKDTVVFRENLVFDLETGQLQSRSRVFHPYRLSSVTTRNDYQPVPVSGGEADRVKKKLWI